MLLTSAFARRMSAATSVSGSKTEKGAARWAERQGYEVA